MGLYLLSTLLDFSHLIPFPAMPVNFELFAGHYIWEIVKSVGNLLSSTEDLLFFDLLRNRSSLKIYDLNWKLATFTRAPLFLDSLIFCPCSIMILSKSMLSFLAYLKLVIVCLFVLVFCVVVGVFVCLFVFLLFFSTSCPLCAAQV